MNRFLGFLRPLVSLNYSHPWTVLLSALLLALISTWFALKLEIDTDIANLVPSSYPNVEALNELQETVGGEAAMEVVIHSPSFELNKEFAEDIIPKSLDLYDPRSNSPFFKRVEYKKDTEVLKDYALYLATDSEVEEVRTYLIDRIEDAKLEANPFYVDFGDEEYDDESGEGTEEDTGDLNRFEKAYDQLIPPEYPINADSTSMVLHFYPTGSRSDMTFLRDMFSYYDQLIDRMEPETYHPEMEVLAGGRLKRHMQELDSIVTDVQRSFGTGIGSVIFLVALYFFIKKYIHYRRGDNKTRTHSIWDHLIRFPVPILIIGIPLLISLSYTFAIAYAAIGMLNTMTSVLFVILFGLGIDYGIHYYARYLEYRAGGKPVLDSLLATYDSTGSAIFASALTTAVALFILVIADFRGFSEFGFISGLGIILAFISMIYIMPAMLVIFERYKLILINGTGKSKAKKNRKLKKNKPYPFAKTIVAGAVIVIGLVAYNHQVLEFEYDFGSLEPEFPEYDAFRDLSSSVDQSNRRNPAYILADSDEDVYAILDKLEEVQEENGDATMIDDYEALQERFPVNEEEEQRKLTQIDEIDSLLQDPFLVDQKDENLDRLRRASSITRPLNFDDIPDFLSEKFITRDGEIGRFIMVYPRFRLADGRNSIAFKNEIGTITLDDGREFHAASTSIVAAQMLELMQEESPYMVLATFAIIFILVNIVFGSLRWSVISMLPLLLGLVSTFGAMMLLDLSFNFYNLVVLPAILGIGNDNGVHLATRYREEGRGSVWKVLRSTGQHITIGSLTTMLGFAGLLLTNHPGLISIGSLAVVGIGMTLFTALVFLPALIQVLEDNSWIRYRK
ncbi:MAG: MMPL family transporter [Balneolales bacterium]